MDDDDDDDDDDNDLLITMLSIVSIATVTSCVFADVITTDKGIPFLSVRICLLLSNLLLSVGLWPVFPHENIEESIPDNKNIEDIIMKHENSNVEFKESLLWDTKKSQVNIQLAYVIARTIAGFLNSKIGGKLIIGISDQKEIKGIENDLQNHH